MVAAFHYAVQSGVPIVTAAIVKLWLDASPRLSIPRASLAISECLTLLAALGSGPWKWGSLPGLLMAGLASAAWAERLMPQRERTHPAHWQEDETMVLGLNGRLDGCLVLDSHRTVTFHGVEDPSETP